MVKVKQRSFIKCISQCNHYRDHHGTVTMGAHWKAAINAIYSLYFSSQAKSPFYNHRKQVRLKSAVTKTQIKTNCTPVIKYCY